MQATGHGATPWARPTLLVSTGPAGRTERSSETGSARVGAGSRWADVIAAAAAARLRRTGRFSARASASSASSPAAASARSPAPTASRPTTSPPSTSSPATASCAAPLRPRTPRSSGGCAAARARSGSSPPSSSTWCRCARCSAAACTSAATTSPPSRTRGARGRPTLPEQATSSLAIFRLPPMPGVPEPLAGRVTVAVRFAWVGDPDAGRAALAPHAGRGHPGARRRRTSCPTPRSG